MRRAPLLTAALALMALAACKEEVASLPDPVELTPEAAGYYCQMTLLEHEGPKGQIHLDGLTAPLFFSQVRDAVAYMLMPEQNHDVVAIYVQDMGRADSWAAPGLDTWIEATGAVYVVGSGKLGGMGAPEFVPFSDETAARAFIADHGGELRHFTDFTATDVLAPTGPATTNDGADDGVADRLKALTRPKGD
mgnify:CR=1 FL=1